MSEEAADVARFSYFAGPQSTPSAVNELVAEMTEEEQTAHNVQTFLAKRPPSPWHKPEEKQPPTNALIAEAVAEDS